MRLRALLATAASLLCSAVAAPLTDVTSLTPRAQYPGPNTQSCTAILTNTDTVVYTVLIGEPYDNGKGCSNIYVSLAETLRASSTVSYLVSTFPEFTASCTDFTVSGMEDMTHLQFEVTYNHYALVNQALVAMYPEVAGGFNCPKVPGQRRSLAPRDSRVCSGVECYPGPNTQSCSAMNIDGYDALTYTVAVGEPYANGKGCTNIFASLSGWLEESSSTSYFLSTYPEFVCKDLSVEIPGLEDMTLLVFNATRDHGDLVNRALEAMYPEVAGGFNCPDYNDVARLATRQLILAPYTMNCESVPFDYDGTLEYSVYIAVQFANGEGCSNIEQSLSRLGGSGFSSFTCSAWVQEDGAVDTVLTFNANGTYSDEINIFLGALYPEVAGGFNCIDGTRNNKRQDGLAPYTQTCTAFKLNTDTSSYTVTIAVPFANGEGCDNVQRALASGLGSLFVWDSYQCLSDDSGITFLYFAAANGYGPLINQPLGKLYPEVNGGFDCPSGPNARLLTARDAISSEVGISSKRREAVSSLAPRDVITVASEGNPDAVIKRSIGDVSKHISARNQGGNTQSCSAVWGDVYISYYITVGEPFANGVGCGNIKAALQSSLSTGFLEATYACSNVPGDGSTALAFEAYKGFGNAIDRALVAMYPNVAGGFNCASLKPRLVSRGQTLYTQSCVAYKDLDGVKGWSTYVVSIGEPYDDGKGCNNVEAALAKWDDADIASDGWLCYEAPDGSGMTILQFNNKNQERDAINAALTAMYPEVAGGFNCPNKGSKSAVGEVSIAARGQTLNTQSCTATKKDGVNKHWSTYTVQIGEPFDGGKGCGNIQDAITKWDQTDFISAGFLCYTASDGSGMTTLQFDNKNQEADGINDALEAMYPEVAGGFNCPNKGSSSKRSIGNGNGSSGQTPGVYLGTEQPGDEVPYATANTQSCWTAHKSGAEYTLYDLDLGFPYQNGEGCGNIMDALNNGILGQSGNVDPTPMYCLDDTHGGTILQFSVHAGNDNLVNEMLASMYPNLAGEFNCKTVNNLRRKRDRGVQRMRRGLGPIATGTNTCTGKKSGIDKAWTVHVGEGYDGGAGCDNINHALLSAFGPNYGAWHCLDDGYGATLLTFSTYAKKGSDIDPILSSMYGGMEFDCSTGGNKMKRAVDPIATGTNTCKKHAKISGVNWTVHVGEGYDGGAGCDNIENALIAAVGSTKFGGYSCKDDGYGATMLKFSTDDATHSEIDAALSSMYAGMVFSCP